VITLGLKTPKAQNEQMFSGLPPKATGERILGKVRVVPKAAVKLSMCRRIETVLLSPILLPGHHSHGRLMIYSEG